MSNNEILENIQKTTDFIQANSQRLEHICHTLDNLHCESYSSDTESESVTDSESDNENSETEDEQENFDNDESNEEDNDRCGDEY